MIKEESQIGFGVSLGPPTEIRLRDRLGKEYNLVK